MNATSVPPVKLQPPGAGLPPIEAWVGRHILFPITVARLPWDKAMASFKNESRLILDMAAPLSLEALTKPVLIKRFAGIEDSSRCWSPAMVLEHLVIVGRQICNVIITLSHGRNPEGRADTAAVKPKGGQGAEIIGTFRTMTEEYLGRIAQQVRDRASTATFAHPWFGELTASKWAVMAAMHQAIHRKQLEKILGR